MASRIFVANAIGLCAFLADVIAEQRWIEFTERALQWESYLRNSQGICPAGIWRAGNRDDQ